MAILAGTRREIVIVVDVAGGAGNVGVAVCKQKSGGAVIEDGRRPAGRVVATGAVCGGERRTRRDVRRIVGLLPSG